MILTAEEKEIARKIVLAFGQTVCGFDLLRSNGVSYCCDVNGFSFVKDSERFWSDSAGLLRQYCLEVTLTLTLTLSLTLILTLTLTLTLILSLILTLP